MNLKVKSGFERQVSTFKFYNLQGWGGGWVIFINYLPDILCILSHLYFTAIYKVSIVINHLTDEAPKWDLSLLKVQSWLVAYSGVFSCAICH